MKSDDFAAPPDGGGDSHVEAERDELLPRGAIIGRYVVLGLLGRGGMGEVYAAYDPELDRKVAVKLVRAGRDRGLEMSEGRVRLLREAQAIAKLSHPNVVTVYDVGTLGTRVFIAMEFIEGHTVSYWLQSSEGRTWQEVLSVYIAAGRGLAAAHRAGMVHRDFKPDNVMVTDAGEVRVMDFGLARPCADGKDSPASASARWAARTAAALAAGVDPESTVPLRRPADPIATPERTRSGQPLLDSKLTETGMMMGTPAYMAPEQYSRKPTDARADQFSFCVALYESVYGRRPFAGKTVAEIMGNVVDGVVTEPPAESNVPAWLRRIIVRGLSTNPADRFPSMEALLDALANDPAHARRRWLSLVGTLMAGGAVVAAAGVAWRASQAGKGLCEAGGGKLAGIWEPAGAGRSARKETVHRAFATTHLAYAERAFSGASQILDGFVNAWTSMYRDTCQATHVRGEQSAEVLDLRMSCLSERLGRLKALSDVFAQANPTVVENAVIAASSLPSLDRCADVKTLRAVLPPPDDPTARARVEALRGELAHVKVLGDSGQCAAAAQAGRKLIAEAKTVGYLPLEAESLNALARLGSECLDPEESVQSYRAAILAAISARDNEAAVEGMILIAHTVADRTSNIVLARTWIDLAGAALRPMNGSQPILESWWLQALARIESKEGQHQEALDTFKRAQNLIEKTEGFQHPDVAKVMTNIGLSLLEMERLDDALGYFRRAENLASQVLGPDHPLVSLQLANEGEVLNALGRYDEARPLLERAIGIWRRAGSGALYLAWGLTRLGETLLGLHRPQEAREQLEEALRIVPTRQAPYVPAAQFALARALWATAQDRSRAITLAESAQSEREQAGASGPTHEQIADWLRGHSRP
jgi:serine/threonine protein kinase/tetratricopeptide (TPR) repeat protein